MQPLAACEPQRIAHAVHSMINLPCESVRQRIESPLRLVGATAPAGATEIEPRMVSGRKLRPIPASGISNVIEGARMEMSRLGMAFLRLRSEGERQPLAKGNLAGRAVPRCAKTHKPDEFRLSESV